jgi:hypothetical protein
MTSPLGEVQITGVDAEVLHAEIVARFRLGGRPVDPEWQGAFGRAINGRLAGIAGRWQLDGRGISVTHVEPVAAARVAAVVGEAVAAANAYVAEVRDAARVDREEFIRLDSRLHIELEAAQAAMRAQLGIEQDGATDRAAMARFDDESPAVEVHHERAGRDTEG